MGNNNDFEIKITKNGDIYRVEISDDLLIKEFVGKIKSDNKYQILTLISSNVLWNSIIQKIDKGVYYVMSKDNKIFNIAFADNGLKIDERISLDEDIITGKKNIVEEKIITLDFENMNYYYFSGKHDSNGSTYYGKYYSKKKTSHIQEFYFSAEECYDEISKIIFDLNDYGISDVIDMEMIDKYVLLEIDKRRKK